jgi:flavin reductase (DIM6/NTAB) family NADH-FMN oxidoreductase RutF
MPARFDVERNIVRVPFTPIIHLGDRFAMHVQIDPPILYFGTPVVLISTMNADATPNLAPMSSAWALGRTVVLGLAKSGQTFMNLERERECVLSFPSSNLWPAVERLAPLTGRSPVPEHKLAYGARYEPRKFEAAGLRPVPSASVGAPRVKECPLQFEARVETIHDPGETASFAVIVTRVLVVHAAEWLVASDSGHLLAERWNPLIYNFRHYFGLGSELGRSFRAARPNETPSLGR